MSNTPEDTGPLTPEQHEEMLRHPLKGQTNSELQDDLVYYSNVLKSLQEHDLAYSRYKQQLDITERYIHLNKRFTVYGVSDVVSLDTVFDTRR